MASQSDYDFEQEHYWTCFALICRSAALQRREERKRKREKQEKQEADKKAKLTETREAKSPKAEPEDEKSKADNDMDVTAEVGSL